MPPRATSRLSAKATADSRSCVSQTPLPTPFWLEPPPWMTSHCDVASAAAVIGRSFDFDLLTDIAGQSPRRSTEGCARCGT